MVEYTGHPLVDVGIATITAFTGKRKPEELTETDLDDVADYITREYVRDPLKSFLTVAFPNSGFTQPAYNKAPEKREVYAERVLRNYGDGTPLLDDDVCVFTGKPAVGVAFGEKKGLPQGRAFRQHIPLLTGENVINFHTYGDAGLPVSGEALLAIQAFPLGCAKSGGRLLAVHSDNPRLMLHFAYSFLERNRTMISLAQEVGSKKMDEPHYRRGTLLIDTLLKADIRQREEREDERPFSLTAYHLTNSGQGVDLNIFHLPLQILAFLREVEGADYRVQWGKIVYRAWETEPSRKRKQEDDKPFRPRRNWLYEDILGLYDGTFLLPDKAKTFLQTYFLRRALRYARTEQGDPRAEYGLTGDIDLVSWGITASFLRRVYNMEKERIEEIRKMGDRLADYVSSQNDKRFFLNFFRERNPNNVRTLLIRTNLEYVNRGNAPIITFDPYIEVFEEGYELAKLDWWLARDLVFIRMVERLHEKGWLGENPDVVEETAKRTRLKTVKTSLRIVRRFISWLLQLV